MKAVLGDGAAVVACHTLLRRKGIPRAWKWRSTVVTKDGPEYVVRIWVDVPARQPRPVGTPSYVYVVNPPAGSDAGFRITQVHSAA